MIATLAVFLLGVALGAAIVLAAALYLVLILCFQPPGATKPHPPPPLPRPPTTTPTDLNQEGELGALNAAIAWVWREVGGSAGVRRWAVRKLSTELEELQGGALGRFFSALSLHSLHLGQSLPKVTALSLGEERSSQVVDLLVDLEYEGELTFTIAAETHTRHAALLSVTVCGVKGRGRLQFSGKPYPHWSFSFLDPPLLDLRVESPGGKTLSHVSVTTLIASQLKRIVRKRHTLPAYKVRYKPLFTRVERLLTPPPPPPPADSTGTLTLGLLHAKGLLLPPHTAHSTLYATLAVADVDWVAVYEGEDGCVVVIRDVVVLKGSSSSLPVTLAMGADLPFVESLAPPPSSGDKKATPPDTLALGDDLLLVDGRPPTSVKSVIKAFRSSTSSKVVWRIRRRVPGGGGGVPSSPLLEVPPASSPLSATPPGSRRSSVATPTSEGPPEQPPSFSVGSSSVFRSTSLPSSHEPSWRESFELQVTEKLSRFINVNVWASGGPEASPTASPSKTPKTTGGAVVTPGGDRLVATLNLSVADVLTECGATGQGAFARDFFLLAPDPLAPEAREEVLSAQAGFEPHMCYGKVSLSFHLGEEAKAESRRGSRPPPVEEIGAEALEEEEDKAMQHSFSRTHFRSATSCHYCNRKIWLKEAFLCGRCGMRVHKKCHERCVANTVCRGSGFYAPLITTSAPEDESEAPTEVVGQEEHPQELEEPPPPTSRRKTLGGLLLSAKNSAAHLRRAGSTSNLSPSTGGGSSSSSSTLLSRSLPPSPTPARKGSSPNPFEGLRAEELETAVGVLAALPPTDTLVAMAKESGKSALSHLGAGERKTALNDVVGACAVSLVVGLVLGHLSQ